MNQNNMTPSLSPSFLERMKILLGEEYPLFLKSYELPRTFGLRVNTSKITCEEFEKIVPFPIRPIPWIENGYFYDETSRPSRCPYYQAGLYYLQEPSAMTPASRIPVSPGEYVLDMCAAPGGKATALGSNLRGEGLLVANDISTSRARALLRNLELFGTSNVFVSNEAPEKLTRSFPEFFHKIILDAPCSGEGMFRKEEALARDWTPEKSSELAHIQRQLILNGFDMLRPGGLLLYSTCTFSPEEDEGTVSYLLENRPEAELEEMPWYKDFSHGIPSFGNGNASLKRCIRIFPHKMNGEGHFMALIRKPGEALQTSSPVQTKVDKAARKLIEDFLQEIGLSSLGGHPFDWNRVEVRKDKVYYLPPVSCDFRGLTFLRNGLYLGDLKKNRFEPSQPLALAIRKGEATSCISLNINDERIPRYFKGETLTISPEECSKSKGWHLLCVNGYPLGFGKLVNGILKNKYPAGWRV